MAYILRQELESVALEEVSEKRSGLWYGKDEWRLAMINQLARILFYQKIGVQSVRSSESYLSPDARLAAWKMLRQYATYFTKD